MDAIRSWIYAAFCVCIIGGICSLMVQGGKLERSVQKVVSMVLCAALLLPLGKSFTDIPTLLSDWMKKTTSVVPEGEETAQTLIAHTAVKKAEQELTAAIEDRFSLAETDFSVQLETDCFDPTAIRIQCIHVILYHDIDDYLAQDIHAWLNRKLDLPVTVRVGTESA